MQKAEAPKSLQLGSRLLTFQKRSLSRGEMCQVWGNEGITLHATQCLLNHVDDLKPGKFPNHQYTHLHHDLPPAAPPTPIYQFILKKTQNQTLVRPLSLRGNL